MTPEIIQALLPFLMAAGGFVTTVFGGLGLYVTWIMNRHRKLFDSALKQVDSLTSQNMSLTSSLSQSNVMNATLTERNKQMEADIKELRRELDSMRRELRELQAQRLSERRTAELREQEYVRENESLKSEISQLRQQLKTFEDKLVTIKSDYESVVTERDKLRKERAEMEAEIKELRAELKAFGERNGELEHSMKQMQTDMALMKAAAAPNALDTAPHDNTLIVLEAKRKKATEEMGKIIALDNEPTGDTSA